MNKIGIISEDLVAICSPLSMIELFRCFEKNKLEDPLIIDRLYKRYLLFKQLNDAKKLLNEYRKYCDKKCSKIIDVISETIDTSIRFHNKFNEYVPIRIGITEITSFEDQFRDLSEYDNLQGPPFWLREYLQEYPGTVLPFE